MRQTAGTRRNWSWRIACALLVLVLISARLVCGLYARYAAQGAGGDSARVADFVFETRDNASSQYLDLSRIQKPGDTASYTFTVSNQSGGAVSEVAEQYGFEVQLNGSMPLACTITKEGARSPALTAELAAGTEPAAPVKAEKTDAGQFAAAVAGTDTYTITVVWPAEANDANYASRSAVAEVLLTVKAEQLN